MAIASLFMFIGVIKFLSLWQGAMKNTHLLFAKTIGTQNDYVAEYFIRGVSAMQFLAGFLILTNNWKIGAQILVCTLLVFISTSYNPYFNGFDYESVTLVANEASLIGLCIILYAYENSQLPEEVKVEDNKKDDGKDKQQHKNTADLKGSNLKGSRPKKGKGKEKID